MSRLTEREFIEEFYIKKENLSSVCEGLIKLAIPFARIGGQQNRVYFFEKQSLNSALKYFGY